VLSRINLINYIVQERGFSQYLEIATNDIAHTLWHIQCTHKRSNFPHSSDEFFASNKETFDIIFIDGLHTEEQVMKDVKHAFSVLNKDGLIILHDCMPPDAWHQREPEEYRAGENWNGAVWKAALRIFNTSLHKCMLLNMDWGCGIIDTSESQVPAALQLPSKLEYHMHYEWLLRYKWSVTEFLRSRITVFYHVACMGNWYDVFQEQMQQLSSNNFNKIHLSVLGSQEELQHIESVLKKMQIKVLTLLFNEDLRNFEAPALQAIQDHAKKYNGYVLYLHSKGVSNPADESKTKWRRLMMKELVENWENCMMQLLNYDVIGVNWRDMPPISHFCGNFWYASTAYLRKLADFKNYYEKPLYKIWDHINDKRLGCEFWIGSGSTSPKVLSLFCRNVDFCNHTFWINK
jgi:hypothetical protein